MVVKGGKKDDKKFKDDGKSNKKGPNTQKGTKDIVEKA